MKYFSKSLIFPLVVFLTSIILGLISYIPNTTLSGWDNLQSELNLGVNISRSLSTSWQEYQGLGLVGGMGHGANLVREVILLFSSVVIAQDLLRYFWHFSMLAIGPLGVYFFLKKVFQNNFAPFTGAMYYLLNLSTLQYFYVPFEAFSSFFGFFPWLLFALINYLQQGDKKSLALFFGISLLATPIFIVQTLFVVYIAVAGILLLNAFLNDRKHSLKKILSVLAVILATNAFWLLPVGYFSATNVSVVDNAKINSIATIETYLQNQDFGQIGDIAQLKGFWFEYLDLQNGEFDRLLSPWTEHAESPLTSGILQLLFLFAVCGVLMSSIKRKNKKWLFSFVSIFILGIFMLTSGRAPFGFIFQFLEENIPLFGQIFRSTFTKWSIVVSFAYAWGLAAFVSSISQLMNKRQNIVAGAVSLYIVILALITVLPMFDGKLLGEDMKVKYPEEYTELYEYLQTQSAESRITYMPMQQFWGWNFYDWGYRGSGFLWYGIEQPMLDRAFDVWSQYNETYYWQASTALYQENPDKLASVFAKYDVSYVLVDESIIIPSVDQEQLRFDLLKKIIPEVGGKVVWQKDFLTLYKLPSYSDSFLSTPVTFSNALSDSVYTKSDTLFENFGTYINRENTSVAKFPFSNVLKENQTANLEYDNNSIIFTSETKGGIGGTAVIPAIEDTYLASANVTLLENQVVIEFEQPYNISVDNKVVEKEPLLPKLVGDLSKNIKSASIFINGAEVQLNESETKRLSGIELVKDQELSVQIYDKSNTSEVNVSRAFYSGDFTECFRREGQEIYINTDLQNNIYQVETKDAVACKAIQIGRLESNTLVNISLPYRSDSGARPHFCLQKEGTSECLNEDVFYNSFTSKDFKTIDRSVITDEETNYWLIVAGRPPDKIGDTWSIEYQAPTVMVQDVSSLISFVPDVISGLWKKNEINLPDGNRLAVHLPVVPTAVNFAIDDTNLSNNCDVLKRGAAQKTSRGNYVYYEAERYGAMCDYKNVNISTQGEYIMRLEGDNMLGRSIKAFLFNQATRKNDLEVLTDQGSFDNSYVVMGWPQEQQGYSLSLETRSFGQPARNRISNVTFYEVPLTWLSQWRIGNITTQANELKILDTSKSGTTYYKAKTTGSGLLKLSQGYDNGWVAYSSSNGFLEHVKVNSWANGWIVPEGEQDIYIFFWPQLLQWFGFVMLILTPVAIWKFKLTKSNPAHTISSASTM